MKNFFLIAFIFLKINTIADFSKQILSGLSSFSLVFAIKKKSPQFFQKTSFLKSNKILYPSSFLAGAFLAKAYIKYTAKEISCASEGLAYAQIHVDRNFYDRYLKENTLPSSFFKDASFFQPFRDKQCKEISFFPLELEHKDRADCLGSNVAFKPCYQLQCAKHRKFEKKYIDLVLHVFTLPNIAATKTEFGERLKSKNTLNNKNERDEFLCFLNQYCDDEMNKQIDEKKDFNLSHFIIEEKRSAEESAEKDYTYELDTAQMYEFNPEEKYALEANRPKKNRISYSDMSGLKSFDL